MMTLKQTSLCELVKRLVSESVCGPAGRFAFVQDYCRPSGQDLINKFSGRPTHTENYDGDTASNI